MSRDASLATRAPAEPAARTTSALAKRVLGPLHVNGIFWYRAIAFAGRLPDWSLGPLVGIFSSVFFTLLGRARRTIATNLEGPLGPCGFVERQRRVFRTIHSHAWHLVERFEQFRPGMRLVVEFEGPGFEAIRQSPRGAVLITAHFGNWESGPMMPLVAGERRLHVVREREEHPATQARLEALLASHPNARFVTHFADDDPVLGAKLLAALRRGDVVTLAGDRPRSGMPALEVRMFGRRTLVPPGPAALARAAEVPIVPFFAFREGRRRYRMVGSEPIEVPRTADRGADVRAAIERIVAEVERAIRERPHHWARWEPVWLGR